MWITSFPHGEAGPDDLVIVNGFSLGHRNVQGLDWHPGIKTLYATERGTGVVLP